MDLSTLDVGVVGASLAGLSAANVLARAGARVSLFERGEPNFGDRGGGLGVHLPLARAVVGRGRALPPHLRLRDRRVWIEGREAEHRCDITSTAYGALWRWLRDAIAPLPIHFGRNVVLAEDRGGTALVTTDDGRVEHFDLLVAADGSGSALRRAVSGTGPRQRPRYAGYVLWRGLVPLCELDASLALSERFNVASLGVEHFVAYPIPSHTGQTQPEHRLINWGWYVPMPAERLPSIGGRRALEPHALGRDEQHVDALTRLEDQRPGAWPGWVEHIRQRTKLAGTLAPHPVYEYEPSALAMGPLVLIGDAGHVASPLTGSGALLAMEDALTIGEALEACSSVGQATRAYEAARRARVSRVVREGVARGRAFRG